MSDNISSALQSQELAGVYNKGCGMFAIPVVILFILAQYLQRVLLYTEGLFGCITLITTLAHQNAVMLEKIFKIQQAKDGYWVIYLHTYSGNRIISLHSLYHVLLHQDRPPLGHQLAHICNNPLCITHTKVATQAENLQMQNCHLRVSGIEQRVERVCSCNSHRNPVPCFPLYNHVIEELGGDIARVKRDDLIPFVPPRPLVPPRPFYWEQGVLCPLCYFAFPTFHAMMKHLGYTHVHRPDERAWIFDADHPRWKLALDNYLAIRTQDDIDTLRTLYQHLYWESKRAKARNRQIKARELKRKMQEEEDSSDDSDGGEGPSTKRVRG